MTRRRFADRPPGFDLKRRFAPRNSTRRNIGEFETSGRTSDVADNVRIDAYARAPRGRSARTTWFSIGHGQRILAPRGAPCQKVYAVDHSDIIDAPGKSPVERFSNVEFVRSNSRPSRRPNRWRDPPRADRRRAVRGEHDRDVVDLRTRLLRPGGRILPARLALYLEPVMLKDGQHPLHLERTSKASPSAACATGPRSRSSRNRDFAGSTGSRSTTCSATPRRSQGRPDARAGARVRPRSMRARRHDGGSTRRAVGHVGVDFGDGISSTLACDAHELGNRFIRLPRRTSKSGKRSPSISTCPSARDRTWA